MDDPQPPAPDVRAAFDAARAGDDRALAARLDAEPSLLHARLPPHAWTLLHVAAHAGRLAVVELLLARGIDPNVREEGDHTTPMHWAAAAGHVAVVRRLIDVGGDVVGDGDEHELGVIGWATCWDGCDDAAHREVVALLLAHGARHHVLSAIATGDADAVRRLVAEDAARLAHPRSRHDGGGRPLHFAVRARRPEMAALLLALGADPVAGDASGMPPAAYATAPDADRPVLEAARGRGVMDLVAALALHDWDDAARLLPGARGIDAGALHLMARRGDAEAVRWLLAHGAAPSARWSHWGTEVTPLHLAVLHGHADVARLLLDAGADVRARDSEHDADPLGWAEHAGRAELAALLRERAGG